MCWCRCDLESKLLVLSKQKSKMSWTPRFPQLLLKTAHRAGQPQKCICAWKKCSFTWTLSVWISLTVCVCVCASVYACVCECLIHIYCVWDCGMLCCSSCPIDIFTHSQCHHFRYYFPASNIFRSQLFLVLLVNTLNTQAHGYSKVTACTKRSPV